MRFGLRTEESASFPRFSEAVGLGKDAHRCGKSSGEIPRRPCLSAVFSVQPPFASAGLISKPQHVSHPVVLLSVD